MKRIWSQGRKVLVWEYVAVNKKGYSIYHGDVVVGRHGKPCIDGCQTTRKRLNHRITRIHACICRRLGFPPKQNAMPHLWSDMKREHVHSKLSDDCPKKNAKPLRVDCKSRSTTRVDLKSHSMMCGIGFQFRPECVGIKTCPCPIHSLCMHSRGHWSMDVKLLRQPTWLHRTWSSWTDKSSPMVMFELCR